MPEDTIIKTGPLAEGRDWRWYPDLNVVVLSDRLDCVARLQAFDELQQWWKRSHLSLVESA